MSRPSVREDADQSQAQKSYCHVLAKLNEHHIPYLLGGSYALEAYIAVSRNTKDLDLFVHPRDFKQTFQTLAELENCRLEPDFSHWLGKVYYADQCIDIISGAANGIATVDDLWFQHATPAKVFGIPVWLSPAEEMIWSKAFIMDRYRFDGADIAHLIHACLELDWQRLMDRFYGHWQILLCHLTLFFYIYPSKREKIPKWVMQELIDRLQTDINEHPPSEKVCRGTLLAGLQFAPDVEKWGYLDARRRPLGELSKKDVSRWMQHLKKEQP